MTAGEDVLLGGQNPSYDKAAKSFLSKKKMLAWILKRIVPEFADVSRQDIEEKYIEGEPQVGSTPVNEDKTNAGGSIIRGDRTENSSITEGWVNFDILFHARAPKNGVLITLIINIEAQKDPDPGYALMKRAIYYASRLISSQKEREFTGSDYDSIAKVYTIWLCMASPEGDESAINSYTLNEQHLFGDYQEEKPLYDLINVTMLYIGKQKTHDKLIELLRLVFLADLNAEAKKQALELEYEMNLTDDMREELDGMCNLSEGIYERGMECGIEQGALKNKKEIALKMLKENLPVDMIARLTNLTKAVILEIGKKNGCL